MRKLIILGLAVLLCGCGVVGATPTPNLMPQSALRAFTEAGLVAIPDPGNPMPLALNRRAGLIGYQTFVIREVAGVPHTIARFDTAANAEAARAACMTDGVIAFRRDKLVLVWSNVAMDTGQYGLYFTVLQTMR